MKKTLLLLSLLLSCLPASFAEPVETPRARALFIGDIMAHKEQIAGARGAVGTWDFAPQFRRVKPLFEDAMTVGNLETVFAGEKSGYAGYPSFNTPDSLAEALADLGVNILMLANNHILDRGAKGALRTLDILDDAGILWTGIGRTDSDDGVVSGEPALSSPSSGAPALDNVLTVDYAGVRWAFVNYTYGSNRPHQSGAGGVTLNTISGDAIARSLRQARQTGADIVVACLHWGNEYQYNPSRRQRETAALCLENGADIIVGTHPHVLQPVEIISSDRGYHPVVWSLGNFVSWQRTLPRERSVILAVDVDPASGDSPAAVRRISVAPTRVYVNRTGKIPRAEVVYAGESQRFNHAGLPLEELKTAQDAGRRVLDFLGVTASADAEGFYTLWDLSSPDALPEPRRKAPL